MEFINSPAIDFAHYSEYPNEYDVEYMEEEGEASGSESAQWEDQLAHELFEEEQDYAMEDWQSTSSFSSSIDSSSSDGQSSSIKSLEKIEEADVVDDEELRRKKVQAGYAMLLASSTEMLRIRFPFQSLSVRFADFLCLQEEDFLNDTIIDFYLNHIVEHLLPDEPDKRVTVLPSVFWHNLSLRQSCLPEDVDSMTGGKKDDARFGDILEFLTDFELIDVDYIVVPVNEWEHWSLAVVCHPFTPQACIVCFDSQLAHDPNNLHTSAELIADFLMYSYSRRRGSAWAGGPPRSAVPSNLVQQDNNYDCGLFILEFARRFLLQPPQDLPCFDFAREYADFTVAGKRPEMQRVVLSLCSNRGVWENILQMIQLPAAARND